ncbi:uncharacterized protein [Porites lutea]|uniref:uncharacterized protein isoform X1 n=1 Tax=Porites lutea TaxID=51062 RepID=UPI003CC563C1
MYYTCTAEAKPYASIRWMLNGQNLTNTAPYNITETISGPKAKLFKTFGYLNIKHLTWQQYGNFSCVANNDAGSVKQNTELEVRYRPVVQSPADHPKNLTLAEGETATFNCKTIGNPPTTAHKWQFNGSDLQGEACNNCPTTTLTIGSVERKDEGWYGCLGTNSLGDGPPAKAQLLIKRKPKIDYFPKSVYTVNETNNITMVCGADGVPRPTITWKKMSSGRIVGKGEEFHIVAASETDDGVYICFAENELGDDSKGVTLQVQTRPTILTSTPTTTNIPGAAGEQVDLTCTVKGKPSPTLSWRRDPNGIDLSAIDEKVESITIQVKATTMKIIVTTAGKEVGDKFYCFATNILGNDTQQYIIRERGPPDPPQDVKVVSFTVPDSETVSVNVSWTPGYSGGYDQQFSIHYRKKGSGSDFTEEFIGPSPNNMHTVQQLSPNTEYEFMMQASNQRGNSPTSPSAQVTTSDADRPPRRGTVTATRVADDPTEIVVTWTVTDNLVNKLKLEVLDYGEGSWSPVSGASDMTTSTTQFKVTNLKADAKYKFRLDMRRPGENNPEYVESNEVPAVPIVGKGEGEPLKNWMIAVIAAVGGVLLIGIVILCLCCFMRRKKSLGADRVNMSQTSSYVVGGPPDVSRSLDTRPRSYGMESVEDDPFIEAHFASMQSMNSTDGKKKKGDSGVNLGYLSQDSVQPQSEMLMNPGSRLSRNHPVAQSTGDLDSAYSARGPQRDFNTLPPYHEPPSFEEAMRQSGRKPKIRKSTGDLTGPGQGRHAGRRPRPSPSDEPTDSSDGETRFTPQRAAPPPPRVRPNELNFDPRYAPVDQQGRVLGPRVLPQGLSTTSAPRNGPIDPTVPYSMPQKKKSTKKPRSEPSEPAIGRPRPLPLMVGPSFYNASAYKGWPPPQYTPEDRSPAEHMPYPGDLDLDDPVNLPRSERPPDLPPPMAMLPSNRGMSNYHHDPHDGLPEPPAFLRDVVYPPYGRDTQSDSDGPAPYNPPPPSSNRQRKPYVNIHGQLVRPPSRESDEFLRPESLRSSRDALTPEPEMPVRPRQPRGSEFDDRREPEINYFSYLV